MVALPEISAVVHAFPVSGIRNSIVKMAMRGRIMNFFIWIFFFKLLRLICDSIRLHDKRLVCIIGSIFVAKITIYFKNFVMFLLLIYIFESKYYGKAVLQFLKYCIAFIEKQYCIYGSDCVVFIKSISFSCDF